MPSVEAPAPSTPFPLDLPGNRAALSVILFRGNGEKCPPRLALGWDAPGGEWCRPHLSLQQVLTVQEPFPAPCRRAWKSEGKGSNTTREKGKENP